jgi:hypothetical protein
MQLAASASRWGNIYRFRYYIDGRRVSKFAWDSEFGEHTSPRWTTKMVDTKFGFRMVYEER